MRKFQNSFNDKGKNYLSKYIKHTNAKTAKAMKSIDFRFAISLSPFVIDHQNLILNQAKNYANYIVPSKLSSLWHKCSYKLLTCSILSIQISLYIINKNVKADNSHSIDSVLLINKYLYQALSNLTSSGQLFDWLYLSTMYLITGMMSQINDQFSVKESPLALYLENSLYYLDTLHNATLLPSINLLESYLAHINQEVNTSAKYYKYEINWPNVLYKLKNQSYYWYAHINTHQQKEINDNNKMIQNSAAFLNNKSAAL